jgi:hypothetical protein
MKFFSDEPTKPHRATYIVVEFDKLGKCPEGLNEWIEYCGGSKKLRGTNVVHKLYVENGALNVRFGSGTLNQYSTARDHWLTKRLLKVLREMRDKYLKPEKASVWIAVQTLNEEKIRNALLSLTSPKEERMKAYKKLRTKVRILDEELQEFILRVNAQITRIQKVVEGNSKLSGTDI